MVQRIAIRTSDTYVTILRQVLKQRRIIWLEQADSQKIGKTSILILAGGAVQMISTLLFGVQTLLMNQMPSG